MVNEGASFAVLSVGIQVGPDDDIAVAVAVDVSCAGDGAAEFRRYLIALRRPGGRSCESRGRSLVHVGPSFRLRAVIVRGRCDDDVAEAVTVDVPGRPHPRPELRAGLVPFGRPARGAGE